MKLGEALTLRARQAQKLNDLQGRIKMNTLVQEGTNPAEDPNELISEYVTLSEEHQKLVTQIQTANADTNVEHDNRVVPLLQLLQEREGMTRERNIYGVAANAGSPGRSDIFRYARSELQYVSCVDVADLRRSEEEVSERIRVLDARIQAVNWETELP